MKLHVRDRISPTGEKDLHGPWELLMFEQKQCLHTLILVTNWMVICPQTQI